jgi:hypothetical protein
MAKIQEEIVVIRLSKLVKDSTDNAMNITEHDFSQNVEALIQELVGDAVMVEVVKE